MASRPTQVGVVGLGAMGSPMSGCLIRAGHVVHAYDNNPERRAAFAAEHQVAAVDTLADVARKSEVIITVLPNSDIVESVLFGEGGLAGDLQPGAVLIDMTSGVPTRTQGFCERLAQQGVVMFDAPISGGVPRARTGELTIMAGGDARHIDAAMPVLSAMGTVIRTGKEGSGHAMKALNNLVSSAGFLIGIEALLIGSKFGIDPATMVDVLNVSTGMNNSTQKKFKQYVLNRQFNSGFALGLMAKDLNIALGMAHELDVNAPFAELCRNLWAGAQAVLGTQADHTAVTLLSEQLAGLKIGDEQAPKA